MINDLEQEIQNLQNEVWRLQIDLARLQRIEYALRLALPHLVECAHHHRDDYTLEEQVIPIIEVALKS